MPKRGKRKKKSSTKTKIRRRTWDPVEVAEKLSLGVASMLGLDALGFTNDQIIEILRDLLVMIIGDRVSKPKAETLVNAILRNQTKAYSYIASRILEVVPEGALTPEQLDFVVNYIGDLVIPHAPRLYREMKRLGIDMTPQLQAAWESAWRNKGDEGPVGYCPRCGLRAVDPTGTCMVCGYTLKEDEIRKGTDFIAKLREFVETSNCDELEKTLNKGVLYVDHYNVSISPTSKWAIEIPLKKEDISIIKEVKERKCKKKEFKEVLQEVVSKL